MTRGAAFGPPFLSPAVITVLKSQGTMASVFARVSLVALVLVSPAGAASDYPAVTIARALTNSFSGIAPTDVPMFIVAQLAGALAGLRVMSWFFTASDVPKRLAALERT